jgi:hypothetical protein
MTQAEPTLPNSHTKLTERFFGSKNSAMVTKNTLHDQILNMNMHAVDLRLVRQILELRTSTDSQIPAYWGNSLIHQLIAARLIEFRKLTESHDPNSKESRHTLSFSHLLYELSLKDDIGSNSDIIRLLHDIIAKEYQHIKYIIDKFIVHAATEESRKTSDTQKVDISIAEIWQHVLCLNHVYTTVRRLSRAKQGACLVANILKEHLPDLRRCFLLSAEEFNTVADRYDESIRDLKAIQSGTAPAPWDIRTP